MRRKLLAAVCAVMTVGGAGVAASPASASSHREAPLISQDPVADNTDVYMFRDPNDASLVNIVSNYIGLEQPAAGPNFNRFGDDVLYEIHLDNNGDAVDDVTYQFRFRTEIANPNTFLYNTGQITAPNAGPHNVRQFYSVRRIDGAGASVILQDAPTPPVNIGPRSTPDYESALAQPTYTALPGGGRVFAGQRKDPFYVDLGSIFDLLGLRPLNAAHAIPLPASAGVDSLDMMNVHTIALQVPISSLLAAGANPGCTGTTTLNDRSCVLGVWASSSRQSVRVLSSGGPAPRNAGRWVQVSRLGFPLVNEVLIPLGQKDRWNARHPANDLAPDGFGQYILDPEPARLIPVLYPGVNTPPPPRTDIVAILQGAGAGLSGDQLLPPADLLRLNVSTPVSPSPDPLGILAGDAQGFPNGRRLVDDIVDVELRVVAGGTPFTPAFNVFPNNALTDGVGFDAEQPLLPTFPYVPTPISGYDQPPTTP